MCFKPRSYISRWFPSFCICVQVIDFMKEVNRFSKSAFPMLYFFRWIEYPLRYLLSLHSNSKSPLDNCSGKRDIHDHCCCSVLYNTFGESLPLVIFFLSEKSIFKI